MYTIVIALRLYIFEIILFKDQKKNTQPKPGICVNQSSQLAVILSITAAGTPWIF